jgi:cysteine desulfurase/selenocysteine lyase
MSAAVREAVPGAIDWAKIRADFPILSRTVHGKPLIYLDSANTAQKPNVVIDAVSDFYRHHNANVSRSVHQLGEEATAIYEGTRDKLAAFLGANHRDEIVLTSGTTMATNLVAYSFLLPRLKPGDAVLVTAMEHHADIVPWQLICKLTGARLKVAPISEAGELVVDKFVEALTPEVKFAGATHVSNVLGTINPVKRLARECRKRDIPLLIDGSQSAPHLPVNVKSIGCDFYVVTGHKMCGPTGTGALWARRELLEAMPPFFGGGDMIKTVTFACSTFADSPHKFEAGTPNIAGFAGLTAAIDYLAAIGMDNIEAREHELLEYATPRLEAIPGLRVFGHARDKAAVISFLIDGIHAHDLATLLDQEGVAVRSGHHCAHPLMQFYGVTATCRASLAFWNTEAEIDAFIDAIGRVRKLLQ